MKYCYLLVKTLLIAAILATIVVSFKHYRNPIVGRNAVFAQPFFEIEQRSKMEANGRLVRRQPVTRTLAVNDDPDEAPFDDAMIAHMDYVVAKLTERMRTKRPLGKDDLGNFLMSCDIIMMDAEARSQNNFKDLAASPRDMSIDTTATELSRYEVFESRELVSTTLDSAFGEKNVVHMQKGLIEKETDFVIYEAGDGPRSEDIPDPNSPFSDLHGLSNTWQMPGMDDMTTDEYYAAINKRIVDMKNKRKITDRGSNTMVDDYFESLSKPRPTI